MRDGMLVIQERDINNIVLREYTWGLSLGGGIGGLLNLNSAGQNYTYLYDGTGNVQAVLNAAQQVVAAYRYDPFGVLLAKTGSLEQPYGFSTKRYHAQLGMVQYEFRNYFPELARWDSRDPLGEAGGLNLYAFVGNNPVNWVDPWGLFQSPQWMHAVFPWQGYWDAAVTAFENGHYVAGVGYSLDTIVYGLLLVAPAISHVCSIGPAVGVAGAAGAGDFIIQGMSKSEARIFLENMGLPGAQHGAVKSAIQRATASSSIKIIQYGADVIVQIMRKGRDGFQLVESMIRPSGAKTVIQKAYDASGHLVHYHPK